MPIYRYTAEDSAGRPVDGHVEAASVGEAQRRLEDRGLRVLEVIQADAASPPAPSLTAEEAQRFAETVACAGAAGVPLSSELRAAAEESHHRRLAGALVFLADEIDRGQSLDDVLESSPDLLPRAMRGLVRAAARTGQLGPALAELVDHFHATSLLRRGAWSGLAYPLVVAGLAAVVLLFILAFVVGGFEEIFRDFGTELPVLTQVVLTWRHIGLWLVPAMLVVLTLLAILIRWRGDPVARGRWLASMPVLGPLWHTLALAEWIGLLRVLVRSGVTLLDALRLAADGVSDANVAHVSRSLADGVARGRSLSQMMASVRAIPASLVPMVRWGEEAGALDESLDAGRQLLEDRVRMRSVWLQVVVPPILLIAIGCSVLLVLVALFLPLMSLIQNLT